MEMGGAVDWSREPETILDGLDHLHEIHKQKRRTECVRFGWRNVSAAPTIITLNSPKRMWKTVERIR